MRFRPGVLFALALATPASAQSPRPTIRAATGAERIRVDGWLDEPAWADAPAAELTQVEPIEGAQPSARTTVRILASAKYLLIGVYAALPPGSGVTAFSKARDAELREEDHIRIVIDPFNDGRSGYLFAVNPLGARLDAQVTNQGEGQDTNWDALWDAAAKITDSSWTVEIRIPISSLSFPKGSAQWAINIQRRVQGRQETDRWASPNQDSKFGLTTKANPDGVGAWCRTASPGPPGSDAGNDAAPGSGRPSPGGLPRHTARATYSRSSDCCHSGRRVRPWRRGPGGDQ